MNKFLMLLLLAIAGISNKVDAQVDSIHFQFQDTLLKAGTEHTFLITVREDISEMLGFQFCIQFDEQNINFKQIGTIYVPDWTDNSINPFPLGNTDLIASVFDAVQQPYFGKKLLELEFTVIHDCRVRDVIRVLSAYRFKADESFNYSEMFFDPETLPIATEYLPFIMLNNKSIDIVNANVYPNPSNGKVKLDFQNDSFQKADLVIYDTNGKVIKRSKVTVNAGQNNIELNRDQFGAAGNYVVKIELDKKIISSRVTIIN